MSAKENREDSIDQNLPPRSNAEQDSTEQLDRDLESPDFSKGATLPQLRAALADLSAEERILALARALTMKPREEISREEKAREQRHAGLWAAATELDRFVVRVDDMREDMQKAHSGLQMIAERGNATLRLAGAAGANRITALYDQISQHMAQCLSEVITLLNVGLYYKESSKEYKDKAQAATDPTDRILAFEELEQHVKGVFTAIDKVRRGYQRLSRAV